MVAKAKVIRLLKKVVRESSDRIETAELGFGVTLSQSFIVCRTGPLREEGGSP